MNDVGNNDFLKRLQSDREIDVIFWKKHPELRKQLVDDTYADKAHFIFELLQNSEDALASMVSFVVQNNDLKFIHDGNIFTEQDITAITDFSKSAKTDTHGTIGKFGIGFKSVFKYTETPHIYSGAFSIKIKDLVYPEPLQMISGIGEDTRFLFPFNHPKKPAQQAVNEIENGLKDLGDNTLLFLTHIRKISYYLSDGTYGSLERIDHDNGHIEIRTCHPGINESISHWLCFENEVAVMGEDGETKNCRIAIAYSIEKEDEKKKKGAKWKIVPLDHGQVSIYFPAIEESSNLHFHVHAPFASTVARANVTKEKPANQALRDHLSELIIESLIIIRDIGMMTVGFLSVLPNCINDKLSEFYKPIQDAIFKAFREQALLPTRNGSHAKIESLFTGPAKIADVLGDDGLAILTGNTPPLWAANPPPQYHRARYFLENLKIEEWEWYELAESLYQSKFSSWDAGSKARQTRIEHWISSLSDDKLMRLYALLGEAYSRRGSNYKPYSELKIIRVAADSGDVHVRAQDVYLQPVDGISPPSGIRYVKPEVYSKGRSDEQKRYALMFLAHIGVRPFDQKAATLRRIDFYAIPSAVVPKNYLEDIAQFVDLFLNHPSECGKLKEIPFLRGTSPDGTVNWYKPYELYLDQPYQDTGLEALFNDKDIVLQKRKVRILDDYRNIPRYTEFACSVGVMAGLEIRKSDATHLQKDKFNILNIPGKKSIKKIDDDYYINGLHYQDDIPAKSPYFLGQLDLDTIPVSYVVWKTMCRAKPEQLKARYVPSEINKHREKSDASFIVNYLISKKWIPNKDGIFKKPADIAKEELHPDFQWDGCNGWLTAIGIGKNDRDRSVEYQSRNQAAQNLKFISAEEAEEAAAIVRELGIEQVRQFAAKFKKPELPEGAVNNPERRRKWNMDSSANAPDRESILRECSVQPWINEDTGRAKAYLRSLYTNLDNEFVCQCCLDEMPFKVQSLHYFEAIQCVRNLKKRHIVNRLALCPTCAAKYQYARKTDDQELRSRIINLKASESAPSVEIPISLAGMEYRLHFVGKHWFDLKDILEADKE